MAGGEAAPNKAKLSTENAGKGVFTDDLIETWIGIKRGEIDQARLAPTPLEYELYFHI